MPCAALHLFHLPAIGRDEDPAVLRQRVAGDVQDGVDPDGRSFNEQNLFATIFTALGIDPYAEYDLPGFPTFHRVEDRAEPIREVLA